MSLHLFRTSLILLTSSETTAVATTFAPPNLSDEEFTTETALGPLPISYLHYPHDYNHSFRVRGHTGVNSLVTEK